MYLPRQAVPSVDFGPVNPESQGVTILTISGCLAGFAIAAVLTRMYVRVFMLKMVGIDDYIMMVACACSAIVMAFFVEEVQLGVGEHWNNPHVMGNFQEILRWSYYHSWILVIGISSVKISVGFFLLRLVQGKWYKRFILGWITFLVLFMLACVGTLVFQCLPVSGAWDMMAKMDGTAKCYSIETFRAIGLFNGAINIFTDFIFATLPIPVILPLQINRRTKISLICILSLGYFACAAAIVKEVLLSNFFTNIDNLYHDSFQIWNCIEMNTGILAACLPTLRPLFAALLETATAIKSNPRGRSNISGAGGKYYIQNELEMTPSRSTLSRPGYGVTVIGGPLMEGEKRLYRQGSATSDGPMSKLEASIEESDSGSEENILPVRVPMRARIVRRSDKNDNGIMRTTEVVVTR